MGTVFARQALPASVDWNLGPGPIESSKCIRSGKVVRAFTHMLNKCLNSNASGHIGHRSVSDVVCVKVYIPWTDGTAFALRNEHAGFGGAVALRLPCTQQSSASILMDFRSDRNRSQPLLAGRWPPIHTQIYLRFRWLDTVIVACTGAFIICFAVLWYLAL